MTLLNQPVKMPDFFLIFPAQLDKLCYVWTGAVRKGLFCFLPNFSTTKKCPNSARALPEGTGQHAGVKKGWTLNHSV